MVIARFVNWPDTLAELGFPLPWKPEHFLAVLNAPKARASPASVPPTTSATAAASIPKPEYLAQQVFAPLWSRREKLRWREDDCLQSFYGRLKEMNGLRSFMAAQVVADSKYVPSLLRRPRLANVRRSWSWI